MSMPRSTRRRACCERCSVGGAGRRLLVAAIALACAAALAACAGGTSGATGTTDVVSRVLFVAGERLSYELTDALGVTLGAATLTAERDGERLVLRQEVRPAGGDAVTDHTAVTVDASTLRPFALARTVQRNPAGGSTGERYAVSYELEGAKVRGEDAVAGVVDRWEQPLRPHSYDNESSLWLWRTVALADGFEARYISINHLEHSQQTVTLRVIDRRSIDVPAGTFETWRLQVRNGRATRVAWINVEAPHQVVQWDNGEVVFRLAPGR